MRCILLVSLVAGVCLGLSVFAPGQENAEETTVPTTSAAVTKYLTPLKEGSQKVKAGAGKCDALLAQKAAAGGTEEFDAKVLAAGQTLLADGKAFRTTVRGFLAGETRRGLAAEVAAVREGVSDFCDAVVVYRQLANVTVKPVKDAAEVDVRKQLREYFLQQLRKRVAARLDSEGLKDIVNSETWREAESKALAHLGAKINERIDREMTRLTGLAFHDGRSLQRAVRHRINAGLEHEIGKLVVRISSNEIVVEVAGALLTRLVEDLLWNNLWPKVREAFREKGRHASRTARSIETMQQARQRLHALKGQAPIAEVTAEIRRARETAMAARYLLKDLERSATEEDKKRLEDLKAAIAELSTTMTFTSNVRFLLNRESIITLLATDEQALADAIDELQSLLRGPRVPEEAVGKVFFIPPYEYPDEQGGTTPNPPPQPYFVSRVNIFTGLCVADLDRIGQHRARLETASDDDAYLPLGELVRKGRLWDNYGKDYLVKISVGGVDRRYHSVRRPGIDAWYGSSMLYGLADGEHAIRVSIVTREGLRIDRIFRITVRLDGFKDYDRIVKRLADQKRELETMMARLGGLPAGVERAQLADRVLRKLQPDYLPDLMAHGRGSVEELLAHLREMLRIAEYVQENTSVLPGNPTYWTDQRISWAGIIAGWCQSVGTPDAYALAREAGGKAEGLAGKAGKSGQSALASLYGNLASLAISTGNDVEAARKYLEQGLKLRVKAGEQVNDDQEKRRWPEWDGKPPEPSTTAPAGARGPRG